MKKKLVFIISGVVLFLMIGIGIAIGVSGSNDPQQLTDDFNEAVQENDVEDFKDVVEADSDMVWPDEQIETTLEMLHEPEYFEETMQILNIQASYYEDESTVPAGEVNIHEILNMGAFYIEEEENVLGNSYKLRVRPYHLHLSTNADADVHFLGETREIGEDGSAALGAYGPGVYDIQGELETAYASNEEENEITLFDQEEFEVEHSIDLSGDPITVESTMPNTAVYIDGDEVEQIEEAAIGSTDEEMFNDDVGTDIGDVSGGHEIHGEAELPWGTATSDIVEVEKDKNTYEITPDPVSSEETENELTQVINGYITDRMEALTEQDMDIMDTDAISEDIESEIESDVQMYDDENYLEGEILGTRIDLGNVDYQYDDGGTHTLLIPVERHDNTKQHREFVGDDDFSEDYQQLILHITYDNDTWTVEEEENDTAFSDDPYMTGDRVEKTEFD